MSIEGKDADVDFGGVTRKVNVSLVKADVGEYVIIHAGFAIQVVDREEAEETIKIWEEMLAAQS